MNILCNLCPRQCYIPADKVGKCLARKNTGEMLIELPPKITTVISGPMEQKLYHFMPGSKVLSVGFTGCPFSCKFCQNFEISQSVQKELTSSDVITTARKIPFMLEQHDALAFTYTEPAVFPDFVTNAFIFARKQDKATVLKTNACIATSEFKRILEATSAVNIDVKGPPAAYRDICDMPKATFGLVMENISAAKNMGVHIEVSIPALKYNILWKDSYSWVFEQILERTSPSCPVRILQICPDWRMPSGGVLDGEEVKKFADGARKFFEHVYIDDGKEDVDTTCPKCKKVLIHREGIKVEPREKWKINGDGTCPGCGHDCNLRFANDL